MIIGICGKSGSGKSTICKVLMGDSNYKVESGSIFYKEIDLLKVYDLARFGID